MSSNLISSFAPGLAVRILLSFLGNVSPKAGWALIGLWDGYAVRQTTERAVSYEAPVIWGLLFVVDYSISQNASFYKTSIISMWTILGIIITDLLSPQHWYDTTSERRKERLRRRNSTSSRVGILPSQPLHASSSRRPRQADSDAHRPIIEEQTAVTFAAVRSSTSLSSDISSLADTDTETSVPNVWRQVLGSEVHSPPQLLSSDETGRRATRYTSNPDTPANRSSDPYDTQLPSPPDTFSRRTPFDITDTIESRLGASGFVPGTFISRKSSTPASRNSTPPLMVPSVHLDPSMSQGTLLSSDSEHPIPADLLSPLDINEAAAATFHDDESRIIPPRRMTPLIAAREIEEPIASSSRQVEATKPEKDDARLTSSSEDDSASDVANDHESLNRAANMYRRRAKDHENEVRKLKKDLKAAGGSSKRKQSIVLRNSLESSEAQAIRCHAKADEFFFRADNPTPSWTLDFSRIVGAPFAVQELKKQMVRFLASDQSSTTIRLGKTWSHDVRQAILQYLSKERIPHRNQDPSVILVTQLSE